MAVQKSASKNYLLSFELNQQSVLFPTVMRIKGLGLWVLDRHSTTGYIFVSLEIFPKQLTQGLREHKLFMCLQLN